MLDPQVLIESFGTLAVLGVGLILFIETATILGSFLPGDSLIFILGITLSTTLNFPIWLAVPIVIVSAIAGSQVGYWTGRKLGPAILNKRKRNFIFNCAFFLYFVFKMGVSHYLIFFPPSCLLCYCAFN